MVHARWAVACLLSVVLFVGVVAKRRRGRQRRESAPAAASHLPGRPGVPDGPGGSRSGSPCGRTRN